MALKTLIFGVDDMFNELQPYYAREVQRGNLEVVAFAVLSDKGVTLVDANGKPWGGGGKPLNFELAIISSLNDFYRRMKFLEAQGFPRNRIIDGRVFSMPGLDFSRLLSEGVAYAKFNRQFSDNACSHYSIYPRVYNSVNDRTTVKIGTKSYIAFVTIDGTGIVNIGNFCSISWNETFEMFGSGAHNYRTATTYDWSHLDEKILSEYVPPFAGNSEIKIGNDVWIGRGCFLKCGNPKKPLVIGDGAVIASDSVVVKNVPPYAIVGGNPAKVIKYRFPPHVIKSLLRIKWWDWSIDKIYDNFKYFNDINKFISLHDK